MSKRSLIYLGCAAVILVVFLFLWIIGQSTPENQPVLIGPSTPSPAESALSERDVTLYFASPDATHLIASTGRINCVDEQGCLREVVSALIRGPVDEGVAVLPARSHLLAVQVEDDLVTLDFDRQLVEGHPGGSQSELLTVYALTNSIAVNFSHLRRLQITVDGGAVDTLKGHVDLRRPLMADFTYSRKASDAGGAAGSESVVPTGADR